MNYCVPMQNGSLHCLTMHDAEILRGFLGERLVHAPESDQSAILRMLDHVKLATSPESQYSAIYEPRGYEPAWKSAA